MRTSPNGDLLKKTRLTLAFRCLKWQAYLALRGLKDVSVLWSVAPSGGIDGRLPNLQVPMSGPGVDGDGELLAAHLIPTWVDGQVPGEERGSGNDPLEGYRDEAARDESRAWVSLLEGTVHAALVRYVSRTSTYRWCSRRHNTNRPSHFL